MQLRPVAATSRGTGVCVLLLQQRLKEWGPASPKRGAGPHGCRGPAIVQRAQGPC